MHCIYLHAGVSPISWLLFPCVLWTSNMYKICIEYAWGKRMIVFYREVFQLLAPSQCQVVFIFIKWLPIPLKNHRIIPRVWLLFQYSILLDISNGYGQATNSFEFKPEKDCRMCAYHLKGAFCLSFLFLVTSLWPSCYDRTKSLRKAYL